MIHMQHYGCNSSNMSKQFPNVGKFPQRLDNISTRLMYIITEETSDSGRFGWLENATGIGRKTWQAWFTRSSMPSGNMLEAAGRLWPQYAFWLVTGMTDENYGHSRPIRSKSLEPKKSTARMRFKEYFEYFAHMQYMLYGDTNEMETEREAKKKTDLAEFELFKRKKLREDEMRLLDAFEEKEIRGMMNEMTSKHESS
jgi:hypothetical protein